MRETALTRIRTALAISALALVLASTSIPLAGWAEELPNPVALDPPVVESSELDESPAPEEVPTPGYALAESHAINQSDNTAHPRGAGANTGRSGAQSTAIL
jgi:hypothetical protein